MFGRSRFRFAAAAILIFSFRSFAAPAQDSSAPNEVGIMYYSHQGAFKPLDRDVAQEGGRSTYSAKVKGAHSTIRLNSNESQAFRVCGVDPTRFKLYRLESKGKSRSLVLAKNNMWIGGSKMVVSQSEVPVRIEASGAGCFSLFPKEPLKDGEFGFSPEGSLDVFTFGVGE